MKIITLPLLILTLVLISLQIPATLASPDIYLKDSPASGVIINPGKLMDFKVPTQVDPSYLTTSSGIEYYWYSSPYVGTIPGPKAHGFHLYYTADTTTTITVTVYLAVQQDGSGIPPLVSSKTYPLEIASTVRHIIIPDVITIPETKLNGERIKLSISSEDPITIYYDSTTTPSVLNQIPQPPPPTIYVDAPESVPVSTEFDIIVWIRDIPSGWGMISFDIEVKWDPNDLEFIGDEFLGDGRPGWTGACNFIIPGLASGGGTDLRSFPADRWTEDAAWLRFRFHCLRQGPSIITVGSLTDLTIYIERPQDGYQFPTDPEPVEVTVNQFGPVGGVTSPINKLEILTPYMALAGLIIAVSTVYFIKRRKD